jgi:DNA-binding LytR/AlgR family response regulator
MNILIIEDEQHAANRLEKLVLEIEPNANILDKIDSVESAVNGSIQIHHQIYYCWISSWLMG